MFLPAQFREDRLEVQHELIRAHPLGLLVAHAADGLDANHIPFVLDAGAGERGTLRCHVARPNPLWSNLASGGECLVVFQGPQAYVTPSWYPTKRETGRVVPTWNYAAVHCWGRPRVIEDIAWLSAQIDALTRQQEAPRAEPWGVTDAPEVYIAAQLRGIVGIEIPIARIEGKWKASQNRSEADRAGVVAGLQSNHPMDRAMADTMVAREAAGREPN